MGQPRAISVVETPTFLKAAGRCMSEEDREEMIDFVARHPEHGDLIPGTGGVRKLRWGTDSGGKRGGVRVIYYFHSEEIPLFLLTAYAKSRKANLSPAEKNKMRQVIRSIVDGYHKS